MTLMMAKKILSPEKLVRLLTEYHRHNNRLVRGFTAQRAGR